MIILTTSLPLCRYLLPVEEPLGNEDGLEYDLPATQAPKKVEVCPNEPCPCGSGKKLKKCCGR